MQHDASSDCLHYAFFQNQYKRAELLWVKIKDKALYNSTTADIATHN